jgi:hypothetical protein
MVSKVNSKYGGHRRQPGARRRSNTIDRLVPLRKPAMLLKNSDLPLVSESVGVRFPSFAPPRPVLAATSRLPLLIDL